MFKKGASAKPVKVLRIGIVQDGKVVHERLIKSRQNVTIGESPRNTFVFPSKNLPKKFTLFQAKGDGYNLNVTKDMQGKVARADKIIDLDQLRSGEGGTKKGDAWTMALADGTRGRVVLDNLTVLFQFVPAPPESVRMANRQDFRPRLLDDEDPIFVGSLSVFMAIAAAMMIYVMNTDPVVEVDLKEHQDRFVEIMMDVPDEPKKVEETPTEVKDDGKAKEDEKEEKKEVKKEEKKEVKKTEKQERQKKAYDKQKVKEQAAAQSALVAVAIGTRGEHGRGTTAWENSGTGGDLEAIARKTSRVKTGGSDSGGLRKGRGGDGDAEIGGLSGKTGGRGESSSGPTIVAKTRVSKVKPPSSASATCADGINKAIKKGRSKVNKCYERAVGSNKGVAGKMVISARIARGRVVAAKVAQNGTGDSGFGGCVQEKVKSFKFPQDCNVTIKIPFSFSSSSE